MRFPIEQIQKAIDLLQSGTVKRIDGNGWSAYMVGKIIRIDLEIKE